MKVQDIPQSIDCETYTPGQSESQISGGYTSDLLSDVMANAEAGNALITIQAHKNTVAVANLVGLPAIILCNGRSAPADMLDTAKQQEIAVFSTKLNQFETSHLLAQALEKE